MAAIGGVMITWTMFEPLMVNGAAKTRSTLTLGRVEWTAELG